MQYTKSELRKAKSRIKEILHKLSDKLPYVRTKDGWNWMYHKLVGDNLEELNQELVPVNTHIMDNDDYSCAVEINDMVAPVWKEYCKRANRGEFDVRQDPYPDDMDIEDGFLTNTREVHSEAFPVQATINELQTWIKEQKPLQTSSTTDSFFRVFEAVAHDCILSIGFKYRTRTEKPKLPDIIVKEFEVYRSTKPNNEILMQEIANRIIGCETSSEVEQYVCSLLLPFKEFCEVLRPPTTTKESRLVIKLLCTGLINQEKLNQGTIEYCLRSMLSDMNDYALRLYKVLIQNSLDLNVFQQKTGVYLRREWNPADGVFFNIGDWDLVEKIPMVDTDEQRAEDRTVEGDELTNTSHGQNNDLKSELTTTEKLQSIFYNDRATLQIFLQRTKGKKGARIVDDVWVLIQMGKIDNEEAGEDLRQELLSLGYDTTTKQNWSDQLGKRRHDVVFEKIKKEYQSEGNSTKE